jgi:O-antigen/teichoic acid export membrane protein
MACTSTPISAEPLAPAAALRHRMLAAAAWLLASNLGSQLLRLGSNLLLTRLLLPEAFGLVAVANTLYFALAMFSDLGIWQSVVRSARGTQPRFLGSAWVVQVLRGALLAGLLLALAIGLDHAREAGLFAAGTVYADPRLPGITALFALSALLQGLESMKLALAQRELRTGELARLDLSSQLLATVLTLLLAWQTASPWALALGSVAGSALRTAASHLWLQGPAIRPCWDGSCARELLGFGKWIFASSIIGFLAAHGEKLILGASLQAASFGRFTIAATLIAAIAGLYASLNGHLVFARLSEALRSGQADEATQVYRRVQHSADLLLGLLAGLLLLTGQWVVWLLYDARYRDAGWMLQWLGLGLLAMRYQVLEQLMFARGQPALVTANNSLRALALLLTVPAGYRLGGEPGAVAAVVLSQFAGWPLALRFQHQQGLLSRSSELAWPLALAAGMALGWGLDRLLSLLLPALATGTGT